MTGRRVTVDPNRCVGAGQCVMAAPDIFDQNQEGVVVLLEPRPDEDMLGDVTEAVRRCPVEAIATRDG